MARHTLRVMPHGEVMGSLVARTSTGPQQRLEFGYDWRGRRIMKKVWNNTEGTGAPSVDRLFAYDGWNLISELGPLSTVHRSFAWGLDLSGSLQGAGGVGGLLWVNDISTLNSQPSTHLVSFDGNGNVVALFNATDGSETARYEYGPFGEVIRMTGPACGTNPFRFSTKFQDDETDLLYYGYRYYNASAGRWLSRDRIGEKGGRNVYGAVGNNLVLACDPLGLKDFSVQFDIHEAPWKSGSWVPLKGHIVVSVEGVGAQISFTLTRPDTSANKAKWRNYEVPWRPSHRGANGWAYPNLAAMFNARGSMRYGGADPNKTDPSWPSGLDNDFGGVTIQGENSAGAALVSADWVNDNGATSLDDLSHSAHIERKFVVPLGDCPAPIGVWFVFADITDSRFPGVFDGMLDAGWPLEFMGTVFSYTKISWTEGSDGSLEPKFENANGAPPPSPMQWHWGQWMLDGALPRYFGLGN